MNLFSKKCPTARAEEGAQKSSTHSQSTVFRLISHSILLGSLLLIFSPLIVRAQNADPQPSASPSPSPAASPAATPTPLPSPKSTPLSGAVEGVKDMKIEAKIQAYRSIKEVSDTIAGDIYDFDNNAKIFVLYRGEDYKTWQNYRTNKDKLENQMKTLKCNYHIWLSLFNTAFEPVGATTNTAGSAPATPARDFFRDVPKECELFQKIASNTPAVQNLQGVIRRQDKALQLEQQVARLETEVSGLRNQNRELENRIAGLSRSSSDRLLSLRTLTQAEKRNLDRLLNLRVEELTENKALTAENSTTINPVASAAGTLIGGLSPITAVIGTAIDLISYFRSDVNFSTTSLTLKDNALRATIADSLKQRFGNVAGCQIAINRPVRDANTNRFTYRNGNIIESSVNFSSCLQVYDLNLYSPSGGVAPGGIEWMKQLNDLRERSRVSIAGFEHFSNKVKNFDAKIVAANEGLGKNETAIKEYTALLVTLAEKSKDANTGILTAAHQEVNERLNEAKNKRREIIGNIADLIRQRKEAADQIPAELDFVVENLKAVNTSFDNFASVFTKVNETTNLSPQMIYEKTAQLDYLFSQDGQNAYWLDVNALEADGNNRVRKNLFRYFYYPDIAHNGGSIVQYSLGNADGKVLLSNTETKLTEYRKSSNISKPKN
jgi:uncharacterized coiled-coil DUF342 family protein